MGNYFAISSTHFQGTHDPFSVGTTTERDDHSKWGQSEKDRYHIISLVCGV